MLYRPEATPEIVEQINEVIRVNPTWNRTKISVHLCELWDWRFPDGRTKEMSCRGMLRVLDKSGKIALPIPIKCGRKVGCSKPLQLMLHDTTPVETNLSSLLPLRIESKIETGGLLTEYKSYIDQYHYLGFGRTVGENMKYMVYSKDGILLSCLLFGSAAWSCHDRDEFIGWDKNSRVKNLKLMTNNTRYLILPWVNIPHLASHILSLIAKRVSEDWEKKYGHPIICLETFVEQDRFKGTCYKAANWIYVGETTGKGRDSNKDTPALPIKDIYLYPLHRKYKRILGQESIIQ
jgi:hypothetical protein